MLLFGLFFIFTVASIIVAIKYKDYENTYEEITNFIGILIGVIGAISCIVMLFIFTVVSIGAPADIVTNQQLYNSLTYQLEHNLYDNDNDIGKKELYNQITDWNVDLAKNKRMQHNIWIGMFYPNIYDQFDFITFPEEGS